MTSYSTREGSVPVTDTTLYQVFDKARQDGANSEIVFMETGERVFITDIWAKVDQYSKGMLALGLKRGDTLTSMGLVSSECLYVSVAALSIGVGYSHPYAYDPMESSIPNFMELIKPSILVVGEAFEGTLMDIFIPMVEKSEMFQSIKQIFYDNTYKARTVSSGQIKPICDLITLGKDISDEALSEARSLVQPSDPAMHVFSSGSTGKPKCIVHSNKGMANEILCQVPTGLGPVMVTSNNVDEICGHIGLALGVAGYVSKVVIGPDLPLELEGKGKIIHQMTTAIRDESVEHLVLTSTFTSGIISLAKSEGYTFPSIKTVIMTGQILSTNFFNSIIKYLGGIPWTLYGMSELMCITASTVDDSPLAGNQRQNGKMVPLYNVEIKVVDEAGETVPRGEQGEVWIKKYSILSEYKNADPAFKQDLLSSDGFVKSGDMGVMDENGAILLKGRRSDAVRFKVFAEVVYPGPIEVVVSQLPSIREVQVVAVSGSDFFGDEIVYCLIAEDDSQRPTEDEIVEHVMDQLDEMKNPCRIIYFDKFPRTQNSRKISKREIRDKVKSLIQSDPKYGITKWYSELMQTMQGETNIY